MHAPKWQLPLIIALIGIFLWLISPILPPFVLAILLAWLGNPMVERLERAGRSRNTDVLVRLQLWYLCH
jgi:predicted PurR-regulated permease PerM